jgi:Putative Ig domain/Abnormal spindle-like microcephaly-assoc'd, ASPM-SPD-2-Hydin
MTLRGSKLHFIVRVCLLAGLLSGAAARGTSQSCVSVFPSNLSIQFGKHAVGTVTNINDVILTNNCTTNITINSFSMSGAGFQFVFGWVPQTELPGQSMTYGLEFAPNSAQTFNGTFTVNVQGFSPIVVNMTGTGFITQAAASFSSTSLSFGNESVGSTSAAQALTLTNTGTASFTIESVYADPPFALTGFSGQPTVLEPGGTLPLQVTFTPWQQHAYADTLVMTSDQLPPKGATLSGTGTQAKSLAVSSYPVLPSATQGFAYHAQLNVASGTKPYKWSLASGSTLPSGLVLSAQGLISGTLSSSVGVGSYSFTVSVTDSSSPPHTATSQLTLPVGPPTGAACNNISRDVTGTRTPITPLDDLGTGTYLGTEGGLYLNGSNVMPASHDSDGVNFAKAIQPLDGNGNPDPNGKYALLSIGPSIAFDTFLQFVQNITAEPTINPHLVFVPGAIPQISAADYADPNNPVWGEIMTYFLPQSGVTANQVVAAWIMDTDPGITGSFPGDMTQLQSELESIAQNLHSKFPNLTLAFYSAGFYAGYDVDQNPHDGTPEPYSYESAFAARGAIQDQLNGDPAMNYNPANGPVMAPWVAWADYDWGNGLLARKDGLVWTCQDFGSMGTHNSDPEGRQKNANPLLNFFRSDDATVPWFLAR